LPWRPLVLGGDGALVVDLEAEVDAESGLTVESDG
jgi:hypothetical protein